MKQITMTVKNNTEYYLYKSENGFFEKRVHTYKTKPAEYSYREYKSFPKRYCKSLILSNMSREEKEKYFDDGVFPERFTQFKTPKGLYNYISSQEY